MIKYSPGCRQAAKVFQMRCLDVGPSYPGLVQQAVSALEFSPVRKGVGQGATGIGGQMRCDIHQAFITPTIAQGSKFKFALSLLRSGS